jgi:Ala-tRNA(Pro) deacylase
MSAVVEYLERMGIPFDVMRHATVRTAIGEAYALGVAPEIVAKTIVLDVGPIHVLAVIPASKRVDIKLLRLWLRRNDVHLATEEELMRHYPQYELGALPPLGSLLSSPMLIDPDVVQHDAVVFAAGLRDESVRVWTRDLLAHEHAIVTPITESADTEAERKESMSQAKGSSLAQGSASAVTVAAAASLRLRATGARRVVRVRGRAPGPLPTPSVPIGRSSRAPRSGGPTRSSP